MPAERTVTAACAWGVRLGLFTAAEYWLTVLALNIDQGRYVDVTIADLCPSCAAGHIDLSEGAFAQLADLGVGVLQGVTYQYE